jgi:acetyl-CoA carboxylase biotin carboxyl carrier protein
MNFKELKELIEIVAADAAIDEFEVERSGLRLRIRKSAARAVQQDVETTEQAEESPEPPPKRLPPSIPAEPEETEETSDFFYATSPMVGTFYRSPSPEAEPFVKVGDFVEKGSVLCIIEAMKLMNEIEAEVAGEIVSIAVENGHPVEYGERLFAIRLR